MAKWGEGDPRWIVEERPDAKNVNNWHWIEKNAGPWSKDRMKALLTGLELKTHAGSCKIMEIKRMDGEATANNRKAKLIFLYEWDITCAWEGYATDSTEKVEGSVKIPNLSDEFSADEVDIDISVDSTGSEAELLRSEMRQKGVPLIRSRVAQYIAELKEEFSKGLILPTKDGVAPPPDSQKIPPQPTKEVVLNAKEVSVKKKTDDDVKAGVHIPTTSLELKEEFKCRASELYNAFTTPEMVQAFSNSPCQLVAARSSRFVLYHGMVEGIFDELERDKRLKMRWRLKSYPEGHYSVAELNFAEKEDCTELKLKQTLIPSSLLEETEVGWKRHYFQAMRVTFGFGAKLL